MSETIVLRGISVELDGPVGRQFVVDATRAAEGLIDDAQLMETYELTAEDLRTLAANKTFARAVQAERNRRVRTGLAARESAAEIFVRAPKVMGEILDDKQASARHRIEASRELRATAIGGTDGGRPTDGERFQITINIGPDTLVYDKPIAVGPDDAPPKLTAIEKPKRKPKLIISNERDDEQ
jgi:hypothetical protein